MFFTVTEKASAEESVAPQFSTPECVDFEGLITGTQYFVGDSFVDSGAVIHVHEFQVSGGVVVTDGFATVNDSNQSGGTGLDMNTNNVNLAFDFGQAANSIVLFIW